MTEVGKALDELETDQSIGAVIITGRGRAFAAGADIKEMLPLEYSQCASGNFLAHWTRVAENRKVYISWERQNLKETYESNFFPINYLSTLLSFIPNLFWYVPSQVELFMIQNPLLLYLAWFLTILKIGLKKVPSGQLK